MDYMDANSWRQPAAPLTIAADKRRTFWASIISTLLTIAAASIVMLILGWTGAQLPAIDEFDGSAWTD